jgi:hypothetical protein
LSVILSAIFILLDCPVVYIPDAASEWRVSIESQSRSDEMGTDGLASSMHPDTDRALRDSPLSRKRGDAVPEPRPEGTPLIFRKACRSDCALDRLPCFVSLNAVGGIIMRAASGWKSRASAKQGFVRVVEVAGMGGDSAALLAGFAPLVGLDLILLAVDDSRCEQRTVDGSVL